MSIPQALLDSALIDSPKSQNERLRLKVRANMDSYKDLECEKTFLSLKTHWQSLAKSRSRLIFEFSFRSSRPFAVLANWKCELDFASFLMFASRMYVEETLA